MFFFPYIRQLRRCILLQHQNRLSVVLCSTNISIGSGFVKRKWLLHKPAFDKEIQSCVCWKRSETWCTGTRPKPIQSLGVAARPLASAFPAIVAQFNTQEQLMGGCSRPIRRLLRSCWAGDVMFFFVFFKKVYFSAKDMYQCFKVSKWTDSFFSVYRRTTACFCITAAPVNRPWHIIH